IALERGRFDDAERRPLCARLGDALANAGQGKAAAEAYEAAAHGAGASDALEWRRRAADQLLRSGHIDAGLAAITGVLAQVGMEAGSASARGGPGGGRATELLARARGLAERIGHPHAMAFVAASTGVTAFMVGDWPRSLAASNQAEAIFRDQCTGVTWELDNV